MAQLVLSGPIMQPLPGVSYSPIARHKVTDEERLFRWLVDRYFGAQERDEWPGVEPSYYGTSGRAGAQEFRALGFFDAFYWLQTIEEIARFLVLYGPVPLGLDWLEGMDQLDEQGFIRPTGAWRGGHEILCDGVNIQNEYFELRQSWGTVVNDGAPYEVARISFEDLDYLLRAGGDALAIPEVRLPKTLAL
jgi:hypothetical protein